MQGGRCRRRTCVSLDVHPEECSPSYRQKETPVCPLHWSSVDHWTLTSLQVEALTCLIQARTTSRKKVARVKKTSSGGDACHMSTTSAVSHFNFPDAVSGSPAQITSHTLVARRGVQKPAFAVYKRGLHQQTLSAPLHLTLVSQVKRCGKPPARRLHLFLDASQKTDRPGHPRAGQSQPRDFGCPCNECDCLSFLQTRQISAVSPQQHACCVTTGV